MRNLTTVYTIAIDNDGSFVYRNLAKLLVSSILRSGFDGRIVVFHNSAYKLFPLGRTNLFEEFIDFDARIDDRESSDPVLETLEKTWALKHEVASILHVEYEWERLLFLDADCIVTKPLNPLFEGDWEIAIHREPGEILTSDQFSCLLSDDEMETLKVDGINSGIFCLDRSVSAAFFDAWAMAESLPAQRPRCCLDQAAFNRVVLDHDFIMHEFSPLVSMPFHTDKSKALQTVITHWVGASGLRKLQASYGLFMETYFYDPSLTLFNLIET